MPTPVLRHCLRFTAAIFLFATNALTSCDERVAEQANTHAPVTDTLRRYTDRIKDFLQWYKTNDADLSNGDMVYMAHDGADSMYRVNMQGAERYIGKLRASGFFTQSYLQRMRQTFSACDSMMLADRANDGIPAGFDEEFILHTQDPDAIFDNADNLRFEPAGNNGTYKRIRLLTDYDSRIFEMSEDGSTPLINEIIYETKEQAEGQ